MFSIVMTIVTKCTSFMKTNTFSYILVSVLALIGIIMAEFIDKKYEEAESLKTQLSTSITANKELKKAMDELQKAHEAQLNAIKSLQAVEDANKEKSEEIKKSVAENNNSDITIIFNSAVDRLFDENGSNRKGSN